MTSTPAQSEAHEPPGFDAAAVTHTGAVRTLNEDAYLVTPWICLVADGMGGHDGGEVASKAIVDRFEAAAIERLLSLTDLEPLIANINAAVHATAQTTGTNGMGSTLVGVALVDNGGAPSAVVFNVGDSRCYRLCDDEFTLITTDHSHVQELVAAGKITVDDAATHPLRNVVTRAIGPEASVMADFIVLPDQPCRLLLCSDGVSGELDDHVMQNIVGRGDTPDATALAIIEEVLRGPARDNATAVVVDIDPTPANDVTIPRVRIDELSAEITAPRGSALPP